jgi:type II secretory pathway predicted ATPase ExeA
MSKEQEKLVDEAYNNFIKKTKGLNLFLEVNKDIVAVEGPVYNAHPKLLTQEEFINKIKTDDEFAKKWGLTIEERELSFEERLKLANVENPNTDNKMVFLDYISALDNRNIPTKLITISYNDKTIESYE